MRAGVLDLSIEPPEIVCVDTSALIRALFEDQSQHADYLAFFVRIAKAGSVIVYSELLALELAQMCVKSARHRSHGRREESTRLGRELVRTTFSAWRDIYAHTDSVRVTLAGGDEPGTIGSPIRDAAFHLIEDAGIESYDAIHAATAITYGAPILIRRIRASPTSLHSGSRSSPTRSPSRHFASTPLEGDYLQGAFRGPSRRFGSGVGARLPSAILYPAGIDHPAPRGPGFFVPGTVCRTTPPPARTNRAPHGVCLTAWPP